MDNSCTATKTTFILASGWLIVVGEVFKVVYVLLVRSWVGEGLVSGWLPACETESKQYDLK